MSLIDLKKNNLDKKKKKTFTVDEFISDAENYARGEAKIVTRDSQEETKSLDLMQAIAFAEQKVKKQQDEKASNVPFRHATFTLSEEAIAQLNALAKESTLAKSHIIRILIEMITSKDQKTQLEQLLGSKVL